MNQTTWIVGGGVVIIAIAAILYMYTGDGVPTPKQKVETPVIKATTTQDAFATATPPVTTTQTTKPKMETTTKDTATVIMHTTMGDVTLSLYRKDSPKTVENFLKLSREGFYNGVRFHRIIKDFMIQGGDPLSKDDSQMARWGTGGPSYMFADEFNKHKLVRGSLAMANSGPNTNGSQFFIVTKDSTPWLDGKHTNFGEVTAGLDIVMKMDAVATGSGDRPVTPITITSIEVK